MKNILVPIDFTDVGVNALRYAMQAYPQSKISVLHVREASFELDELVPVTPSHVNNKFWEEALINFIKKELKTDNLPDKLSTHLAYGAVIQSINRFCKDSNYDAIFMGTRDKYNFFDQWFGTVSLGTVKTAEIPTYLIPKYATYKGIKNVMIASDDHFTDASLVDKIKTWNDEHKAFVKFLHIQRGKNESFEAGSKSIITELIDKNNPDFSFEVTVLKDNDIAHSLLASAYDMKADMLLVIPEDQNFIQSLFFKSISKDLILRSDIPLLFLKK